MEKKNLALFREFVKKKYKYASIYSNSISKFAERDNRKKVFTIKSDLAHDFEKDEVLYIPINLWRAITRIFKDYVIGMWYTVDFNNEEDNEIFTQLSDRIQLQSALDTAIETQSSIGYSIVRVRKDSEWKPRAEVIPLPNYYAKVEWLKIGDWFDDITEHYIFSVQKDFDWKRYMYVDRYEKKDNGEWYWYYWEKWSFSPNFIFTDKISDWVEEKLDALPLFLFNNDLDNPHNVDNDWFDFNNTNKRNDVGDIPMYFNQSDYRDLADLFQELNDRGSQISIEFIKNLTSKLSVPAWFKDAVTAQALRKWKGEKFATIPDYIVHNPWEQPAQYITKDNSYITTSIKDYIPYLLKIIGFLSTVPSSLLTNAIYWWNNPVWTTEKEFQPFYSRVEAKQQRIYSSLQKLFQLLMTYEWRTVELPTIKFKKPATYDVAERTNTAIAQMNAWIMSKESAIAYTMWYDDTEVQEELDKINNETSEAYKRDWSYRNFFEEEDNLENNEENNDESNAR